MSTLKHQFTELVKNFKGKQLEQIIVQLLESDLYITSEFLNYPNIKDLSSSNSKYFDTLVLFSKLEYKDYKKDSSKYLSLDKKLLNKLKSITIMEIAKNEKVLYFDELKRKLEINSNFELEEILFKIITTGLISAKIDSQKELINVLSVKPRGNIDDINKVDKLLDKWINNMNEAERYINLEENKIKEDTINNGKLLSLS